MWRKSAKLWLERGVAGGQSRAPASPFRVEWCGWELGQESRERVRWTSKSRRSACLWKTARLGWSLSGISFCARCTRSGQSGDRRWGSERGGTVEFGRRNEASVLGSGANFQRICSRNAWEEFMGLQKTWRVACLCQAVFFERVTSWKRISEKFLDRAGGLENPVDSSKRPRWRSHKNEGNEDWGGHQKMRGRSARHRGKKGRSRLFDDLVEVTGGERQHASRVLLGKRLRKGRGGKLIKDLLPL